MRKLAILIPSMEIVHADFMVSLATLQAMIHQAPPWKTEKGEDFNYNILNERGSIIQISRQSLAQQALDWGATDILWLDSDMQFPPNILHLLARHDLPVVACNYVKRQIPAMPNSKTMNGKLLATNKWSSGLEEAGSTGFGCMLMKAEVLTRVEPPWFDCCWVIRDGNLAAVGEDVFFCHKLRELAGIKTMVDHDASKLIGHIGTFSYTNDLCEATWNEMDDQKLKSELMAACTPPKVVLPRPSSLPIAWGRTS